MKKKFVIGKIQEFTPTGKRIGDKLEFRMQIEKYSRKLNIIEELTIIAQMFFGLVLHNKKGMNIIADIVLLKSIK
jgi:hypothetical protein